jgi:hypothetical protein
MGSEYTVEYYPKHRILEEHFVSGAFCIPLLFRVLKNRVAREDDFGGKRAVAFPLVSALWIVLYGTIWCWYMYSWLLPASIMTTCPSV